MKKYLVACYGSLRRGMSNYQYYLSNSEYKGKFTTEPEYTMHSLSYYPALKLNGNHSIVMEVYEVLKKNQYGQYLKDVLDGKYKENLY
mgnify:CR=1 FL=1